MNCSDTFRYSNGEIKDVWIFTLCCVQEITTRKNVFPWHIHVENLDMNAQKTQAKLIIYVKLDVFDIWTIREQIRFLFCVLNLKINRNIQLLKVLNVSGAGMGLVDLWGAECAWLVGLTRIT